MFLKTYMLGLISDINDMLQDVQGKKERSYKAENIAQLRCPSSANRPPMINHAISPGLSGETETKISL